MDNLHSLTNAELQAQIANLHTQLAASQYAYNYQQAELCTVQSLLQAKFREAQDLHARLEQWGARIANHAEGVGAQIDHLTQRANTLGGMVYDREVQIEQYKDREERYVVMARAESARARLLRAEMEMLEEENDELKAKLEELEGGRVVREFKPSMEGLSRESRG